MTDISEIAPAKPALLLLPNLLGDTHHHALFFPASVDRAVATIDGLIAESESAGRRYLGRFETKKPARDIPIAILNKDTSDKDLDFLLEPIKQGQRLGYVSDAGLPCIADPGASLVFRAKQVGIDVKAFVGPSAITLGLMLSGLPAQQFIFHGYLPAEPAQRKRLLGQMKKSQDKAFTHVCIETPYRNKYLLDDLLAHLDDESFLSIAWDLTLPTQGVLTQSVKNWKKSPLPNLEKKAALFIWR